MRVAWQTVPQAGSAEAKLHLPVDVSALLAAG